MFGPVYAISLLITPTVGGAAGVPAFFDTKSDQAIAPLIARLAPIGATRLEGDAVWLRYEMTHA